MAFSSRRSRSEEDEREEEPRSSRRSRDEDQDEEPRGRSRRARDDEPEEDAPRRSRRGRDEDDGDDEPRGRGSRRSRDSDDDGDDAWTRRDRSSRSREDNDPDEDPAPRRGRGRRGDAESEDKPVGRATRGFDSYKDKRKNTSSFADEFKPGDAEGEEILIKFLEPSFFDSYNQHWIEEVREKKKSFVCHDDKYFRDADKGCPLCELGDNPRTYALINILNLSNPRKPKVQVWKCATTVADLIERLAESSKTKPLDREDLYFAVTSKKGPGKNGKWSTTIVPVKARDLVEDFDMDPLEDGEIDAFRDEVFTDRSAVVKPESWDQLDEVAADL